MTARKKDPLKRKPQDDSEAKLLTDVKDPGWHVIGVTEDDEGPGFAYTIGLHHSYRHPEIIVFGLDVPILWRIVNVIGEEVKKGEKFENNQEGEDILKGYLVFFRRVQKGHYREYLGYARWFYQGNAFPVLQASGRTRLTVIPGIPTPANPSASASRCFMILPPGDFRKAAIEPCSRRSKSSKLACRFCWFPMRRTVIGNSCAGPRIGWRMVPSCVSVRC